MRSGQLRHMIAIQEQTDTADGMGGYTTAWADVSGMSSVPAAIWPLKSAERIDAMKLEHEVTHRIRIRYRSGVTTKMRIYWSDKTKTFNIVSIINPDERNIMLEMLATEET
uniref:Putative head-tail joining protein n=1 Tax=viral metagenome TaxID=1070528 RepID=A0A6M3K9C6_9ZZZZ